MTDTPERPKFSHADADQPEYWIVSGYKFYQHATLESAELARAHLFAQFPKRTFRVHRIKRRLEASTSKAEIESLRAQLRDARAKAFEEAAGIAEGHIANVKSWMEFVPDHRESQEAGRYITNALHNAASAIRARAQQQIGAETKP